VADFLQISTNFDIGMRFFASASLYLVRLLFAKWALEAKARRMKIGFQGRQGTQEPPSFHVSLAVAIYSMETSFFVNAHSPAHVAGNLAQIADRFQ
jgi:hypothetical protein